MDEFLARYSWALTEKLATLSPSPEAGVTATGSSPGEDAVMLELARLVAHATERKNAPLSTYLAGRFVTAWVARGGTAGDAAAAAMAVAQHLLEPTGS